MKAPSRYSYYFELISKRKKGIIASLLRGALTVLSWFFGLAVFLRTTFHKKGYRPKAYTISVGNIVAGGTGKTPFTIFLAKQLIQQCPVGNSLGIILRGYKAECEHADTPYIFQKEAPVAIVGDEACLIAKNVPEAKIFCGKNKAKSAECADVDMLIIDDGMQHLALERDLEIVLLDGLNPFGYGHLLPRGLLREPISALKRADLIIITCRNSACIAPSCEAIIKQHTQAPIWKMRFTPIGFFDLLNQPQSIPKGAKVAVACAIAKPDQFVTTLSDYDIVYTHFLDDHETIDPTAVWQEAQKSGATCILCTEKDMVKLKKTDIPLYWLKIDVEVTWTAGNAGQNLQKLIKNLHLEQPVRPV